MSARKKKEKKPQTEDLVAKLEELEKILAADKTTLRVAKVVVNGISYQAIALAGPEAVVTTQHDSKWDYEKYPVGPGRLGFGKTEAEIADLRDNFILVRLDDLMKQASVINDLRSRGITYSKVVEYEGLKTFVVNEEYSSALNSIPVRQFRVKPSGVYGGAMFGESAILDGCCDENRRSDINAQELILKIKTLMADQVKEKAVDQSQPAQ